MPLHPYQKLIPHWGRIRNRWSPSSWCRRWAHWLGWVCGVRATDRWWMSPPGECQGDKIIWHKLSFDMLLQDWVTMLYLGIPGYFSKWDMHSKLFPFRYLRATPMLRHTRLHLQNSTISSKIVGVRWCWPQSWTSTWSSSQKFCCFWRRPTSWIFFATLVTYPPYMFHVKNLAPISLGASLPRFRQVVKPRHDFGSYSPASQAQLGRAGTQSNPQGSNMA